MERESDLSVLSRRVPGMESYSGPSRACRGPSQTPTGSLLSAPGTPAQPQHSKWRNTQEDGSAQE